MPLHQVLVYPIAGTSMDTASYRLHATAKPLDAAGMKWFFAQYLKNADDYQNPSVALVTAPDPAGLPPATVINAQIDPLLSEGEAYGKLLAQAGVNVKQKTYPGVTHEFFGMGSVLDKAKEAQQFAAEQLNQAFWRAD